MSKRSNESVLIVNTDTLVITGMFKEKSSFYPSHQTRLLII